MGGGGQNTTTQVSDPWAGQQPYLLDIFNQAAQQYYGYGSPNAPKSPGMQQRGGLPFGTVGAGSGSGSGAGSGVSIPYVPTTYGAPGGTVANVGNVTNAGGAAAAGGPFGAAGVPANAAPGGGPQYYPGATLADVDPLTRQAQEMARQAAVGPMQQLANSGVWAGNYALTQAPDPANNPFLQNAITAAIRPAVQQFTDAGGPLSQIRNDAVQNGQFGGTRQGIAEGIATGRLNQQMLDIGAQMSNQAYQSGLDAQGRALALLPTIQQGVGQPGVALDAVGQQRQQQQQNVINDIINRWNYEQNLPMQKLVQYQNLVQGNYGSSSTITGPTPQGNPIMGGLGGAAMGASLALAAPTMGLSVPVAAGLGALLGLFGSGGF